MTSALDTSVLVDVLWGDPHFEAASRRAIKEAAEAGALITSPVVVAELRPGYPDNETVVRVLSDLGVHVVPLELEHGLYAGAIHSRYLEAGGARSRVVADFLIASHAHHLADRLIARDRGFFRRYFRDLEVLDPAG